MKRALSAILTFLSLLLVSAHFLRQGNLFLAGTFIIAYILWFLRKTPAARITLQALISSGIIVYAYTTYKIVYWRIKEGAPYGKTLIIMCGVIGFILISLIYFTRESSENAKRN
ncbi:hypothetical protein [Desulfurobacterium sp.]